MAPYLAFLVFCATGLVVRNTSRPEAIISLLRRMYSPNRMRCPWSDASSTVQEDTVRCLLSRGCIMPSCFSRRLSSKVRGVAPRHYTDKYGTDRRAYTVLIVLKLRRRRSEDQARPMLEESAERALLVRVAIFGVYVVVAFVCVLYGCYDPQADRPTSDSLL